jgi:hypothetical protein
MTEREVEREEDMSPDGKLKLIQQDDGDIIVVVQESLSEFRATSASVEFCIPGTGGGTSPETHKALLHLMEAMAADNERRSAKPSERAGVPVEAILGLIRAVSKHLSDNRVYTVFTEQVAAWIDGTRKPGCL